MNSVKQRLLFSLCIALLILNVSASTPITDTARNNGQDSSQGIAEADGKDGAGSSTTANTCRRDSSGNLPQKGSCEGPLERAEMRLSTAEQEQLNPCRADQVAFYREGVRTPEGPLCGECIPGHASVGDPTRSCGLNEYCDDEGKCQALESHPLLGEPCPYDDGVGYDRVSYYGWCGPGLMCIQHVCRICPEGVVDPRDLRECVRGKWTYSEWDKLGKEPVATFLLIICCSILVRFTCGTVLGRILDRKRLLPCQTDHSDKGNISDTEQELRPLRSATSARRRIPAGFDNIGAMNSGIPTSHSSVTTTVFPNRSFTSTGLSELQDNEVEMSTGTLFPAGSSRGTVTSRLDVPPTTVTSPAPFTGQSRDSPASVYTTRR